MIEQFANKEANNTYSTSFIPNHYWIQQITNIASIEEWVSESLQVIT